MRALVIATAAREDLLLEIGNERFRPVSSRPLQPGQVLDLRIIQTTPRLEAVVVNNHLQEQLAVRLPSLSQPFDWSGLLERLQHPELARHLPPADQALVNQLRQFLDPGQGRFIALRQQFDQLIVQLRLLLPELESFKRPVTPPPLARASEPFVVPPGSSPALMISVAQSRQIVQLLGRLQTQLVPLIELGGEKMSIDWQRATAEVFTQLRQYADAPSLPALRTPEWTQALQLLRNHPGVTEQISQQATKLLAQFETLPSAQLTPPNFWAADSLTTVATIQLSQLPPPQQELYKVLQPLLRELKGLLGMGGAAPRSAAALNVSLAPDLLGRIEGLSGHIHQVLTREGIAPLLQQGLQLVAVQLQQLAMVPLIPARGEMLGFLSQLFGLHLERELLLGKQKQALANLKQTLLALQQKSGEDLREPLSRIELFQLCKVRLNEAQLQFLPLPMVGLSDGYLLAGHRQTEEQDEPGRKPQEEVQISLSLRLSSLGSMRVDLNLLPDQGLVVRLACEDRHKMEYLKGCEEELASVLTQMKLRQIHYSSDAQHPLKQLQQSLLPRQNTLLDTRV